MSDMMTQRDLARRLEQTQVTERPGGIAGFDTFYVSGTWVPVLVGTTIAGTFTYAQQGGTYTRIGNRVLIMGRINITAIAVAPTGNLTITGLPITSAASAAASIAGVVDVNDFTGITYTATYNKVGGRINVSSSVIALTESGSGVGAILLPAATLALVGGVAEFVFASQYQA